MVYHLGLTDESIEEAQFALLPGDPGRVAKLARAMDSESMEIGNHREFKTYLCKVFGDSVLVTSTGIGGPSTAIAVEELALLGVHTFIRVGTTGAIQDNIEPGDVILTTAAVRLDGTSCNYAPLAYPAVSDPEVLFALQEAAKRQDVMAFLGITASTDSFYPGQERSGTHSGYVLNSLKGSLDEWKKLNVLNFEMESAALFTVCSALGLRAGCVSGVAVNRAFSERVKPEYLELAEERVVRVAVDSIKSLLKKWHWKE